MCHLYPYDNVKLLRKFFYINYVNIFFRFRDMGLRFYNVLPNPSPKIDVSVAFHGGAK